jgi:hypothetical protein
VGWPRLKSQFLFVCGIDADLSYCNEILGPWHKNGQNFAIGDTSVDPGYP